MNLVAMLSLRGLSQPVAPFPEITSADGTGVYVTVVFVRIEPLLTAGQMANTVEIAYRVVWDEEHTLGARFDHGAFVGLNGSILQE